MKHPLVLAITGASGVVYAARLLDVLIRLGVDVHLTISTAGQAVLEQELGILVDLAQLDVEALVRDAQWYASNYPRRRSGGSAGPGPQVTPVEQWPAVQPGRVLYHHYQNLLSPIASGSCLTSGMVVCPCSGSTLSAVAHGASNNLIQRAADVHLKERRRLILVPRETPLSVLQLENMQRVCRAGAVLLPAMPGWYHGVRSLRDLVDFVVARILDQLEIEHALMKRWGQHTDDV